MSRAFLVAVAAITLLPSTGSDGTGRRCTIEDGPKGHLIEGTRKDDVICAGGGADEIRAGAGDDLVFAGKGHDIVVARRGRDVVFGGADDDIVFGGPGADRLVGQAGGDILMGQKGRDRLLGKAGRDRIHAGDDREADFASGGRGDDPCIWVRDGVRRNDSLNGRRGRDVFWADPHDLIRDAEVEKTCSAQVALV